MAVHIGDELVTENRLEVIVIESPQLADADIVGHSVSHHDDEWLDLSFGDQVVHDEVGPALVPPRVLVLAPAMLEIKDRILLLAIFILRRGVDKGLAELVGAVRPEKDLLNIAVRDILLGIEISVMSRDLDTALPAD